MKMFLCLIVSGMVVLSMAGCATNRSMRTTPNTTGTNQGTNYGTTPGTNYGTSTGTGYGTNYGTGTGYGTNYGTGYGTRYGTNYGVGQGLVTTGQGITTTTMPGIGAKVPANKTVTVKHKKGVKIYISANANSTVIANVKFGTKLVCDGTMGNWYKVKYNGKTGFVKKSSVK